MLGKLPGMKQMAMAKQLKSAMSGGGFEGNPMMANLANELLEAAVAEGGGPGMPGARTSGPKRKQPSASQRKKQRKKQKQARRKSRK